MEITALTKSLAPFQHTTRGGDLMAMPLAEFGITKAEDLEWLELQPGMGGGYPIAADANRYCGTLTLGPGDAFNFHHHPSQDEVIYIIEGSMESWVGEEKAMLSAGDVMMVPKGTVHACFNTSNRPLRLFIVISPLLPKVDEDWRMSESHGWAMVDVSGEQPWASLR
jgi:mannose-6-phosphate isomerase-like protein (cupin superfamily)